MKAMFFCWLLFAHVLRAEEGAAAETLAKAARGGDIRTLENLLSSGVSPDLPDQYGRAPIF